MVEGISNMQEAIEKIQNCNDQKSFDGMKLQLQDYMKRIGMGADCLLELEKRAFYYINEYSEKGTSQNIGEAKKRVIEYIYEMMAETSKEDQLLFILENYWCSRKIKTFSYFVF